MARLGMIIAAAAFAGAAALAAAAAPAPARYVVEMTIEADGRAVGEPARLVAEADNAARFAMRRDAYAIEAIARPESPERVYLHLAGTGWTPERLKIESITRNVAADGAPHVIGFTSIDPVSRSATAYRVAVKVLPAG